MNHAFLNEIVFSNTSIKLIFVYPFLPIVRIIATFSDKVRLVKFSPKHLKTSGHFSSAS